MRLASFTSTLPAGQNIFINPAQILAVTPFNNMTHIHVAVPNQNGTPFIYAVSESLQAVRHEINLAMAN
ncbi:hypothetical protein QO004_000095 [Rhizobium mesoamericanum]|uniref:hypothetical protein n=1 Tax=Rhizobium mesoamericanum TaxID=1079800 RepID=UPI002788E7E0|nr:hypothetical protein [Rhizobium mesoamericanum]MDQ0558322.1 hypothetical protein [Rhizobium mesoamericanum]